jgi:hypothetical protein
LITRTPKEPKKVSVTCYLTEAEGQAVADLADKKSISMSAMGRALMISSLQSAAVLKTTIVPKHSIKTTTPSEIREAREQLLHICQAIASSLAPEERSKHFSKETAEPVIIRRLMLTLKYHKGSYSNLAAFDAATGVPTTMAGTGTT